MILGMIIGMILGIILDIILRRCVQWTGDNRNQSYFFPLYSEKKIYTPFTFYLILEKKKKKLII